MHEKIKRRPHFKRPGIPGWPWSEVRENSIKYYFIYIVYTCCEGMNAFYHITVVRYAVCMYIHYKRWFTLCRYSNVRHLMKEVVHIQEVFLLLNVLYNNYIDF
uniref:Uncharacterized protein n=1 Tax=Lepeophtheirus salmonis TaxID=72036 RepID=A0A0K2TDK6_LEPSM